MVRRDTAVIGLPSDDDDFMEKSVIVDLDYVITLEPIPAKKAKGKPSNGK